MTAFRTDVLAGTLLVVCWSSGFVGAELATRQAPVVTVLAMRTLFSALLLGGWALVRGARLSRSGLLHQVCLGLLVQAVYLGGVFAAAGAEVPAGVSALIAALQPLLVAAVAAPLLGERTSRRQRIGLMLGASGVAVVVAGELRTGSAPPLAFLLPVVAVLGLSAGTVLERRWQPRESLVVSLAVQSAVAAAVFGAASVVAGEAPPADTRFWTAIAWLVVLSTFGGYGSYLFVVRRSGATTASALLLLTPPATGAWAWLMFDQVPGLLALPGVLLSGAGVLLALRPARPARGPSVPKVPEVSGR